MLEYEQNCLNLKVAPVKDRITILSKIRKNVETGIIWADVSWNAPTIELNITSFMNGSEKIFLGY